ncbi:MAG TPA: acetyl-CoA carboxylase, carboxyltransferase subunit beta [Longimicrobiales bacterium]|nr:acetyl-CoA carboxylase, carboxyltransferase subunit beta [Longimicrobiales bacterium]
MAWFRKPKQKLQKGDRRELPSDVFEKCGQCAEILYRERLIKNLYVCPSCGHHLRISADSYVRILTDEGSFEEIDVDLRSADPLGFVDLKPYTKRLEAAERKARHGDAVLTGTAVLEGLGVVLAVMDFSFIGGSMGSVVGEKIARAGRLALERRAPLIVVSASGGARMQEGILSLMQMAKTSAVLARLHEQAVPFISVLTDPTTGGVTASFAMLGDAIIAEPGALIGFAGPRVIEQTIKQELPDGFQRSEFLLQHGMVDQIVDRRELRAEIGRLLRHMLGEPAGAMGAAVDAFPTDIGQPGVNGGPPGRRADRSAGEVGGRAGLPAT